MTIGEVSVGNDGEIRQQKRVIVSSSSVVSQRNKAKQPVLSTIILLQVVREPINFHRPVGLEGK